MFICKHTKGRKKNYVKDGHKVALEYMKGGE